MSPESLILIAICVVCVGGGLTNLLVGYIRGAKPGTKRYRSIVDELRKWRVLEADEPADTERVRELVTNWVRLSRSAELTRASVILILALVLLGYFFWPRFQFPGPPFSVWLVMAPVIFLSQVCLAQVTHITLTHAQMPVPAAAALSPFSLWRSGLRPIIRLAIVSTIAFVTLALGTLTSLFPHSFETSDWTSVRAHPLLLSVLPATTLAMVALCVSTDRCLAHLRPARLSHDDMLSLRASVAFMQQEVNRVHSGLAYFVGWASIGQLLMLPDYGNFTTLLFVLASLVFLGAVIQSVRTSSPMTLPPPELFLLRGSLSGRPDGQG